MKIRKTAAFAPITEWVPVRVYASERTAQVPSEAALRWVIRTHKEALLQTGAITKMFNAWFVHPNRLDRALPALGYRKDK